MKRFFFLLFVLVLLVLTGCSDRPVKEIEVYSSENQIDKDCELSINSGTSMYPTMKEGEKFIICSIKDEIEVDDIVCFDIKEICIKYGCSRKGEKLAAENDYDCHRVIEIGTDTQGEYFITKGDNVWFFEREKLRENDIKYIVVGRLDEN